MYVNLRISVVNKEQPWVLFFLAWSGMAMSCIQHYDEGLLLLYVRVLMDINIAVAGIGTKLKKIMALLIYIYFYLGISNVKYNN